MPHATIDGIKINYVAQGSGPPLIMLSPGGFDSNIGGWSTRGVWKDLRPLDTLTKDFSMIAYDRREAGNPADASSRTAGACGRLKRSDCSIISASIARG